MPPSFLDELDTLQTTDLEAADARTLRLAAHPLTEDDLAALVRYQEAFLAHAEQPAVGHAALAAAHPIGLEASGLADTRMVEIGLALLRAFCGRRWTLQRLESRLAELERLADPASAEKAAKAREELARLRDLEPLARRYGQQNLDLLLRHEARLLALHTRMQKVLNGHTLAPGGRG
jgi:hypothetical protein